MPAEPLVTIALPVRNGAETMGAVAQSVLGQDYEHLELLIADNASTDSTEEVCRELARTDPRVRYHRHPDNIGVVNNFEWTKHHGRGDYFRWIGDNDSIAQSYASRCTTQFGDDPRCILVTTGLEYVTPSGQVESTIYQPGPLGADTAVPRLGELLRLLTRSYQLLDPLYGMVRTDVATRIKHDQILRGDEVYAFKLALAGPWRHIPDVLGRRHWNRTPPSKLVDLLEVPRWQIQFRALIQAQRMLGAVNHGNLARMDAFQAQADIIRFYFRRHWVTNQDRARRAKRAAARRWPGA